MLVNPFPAAFGAEAKEGNLNAEGAEDFAENAEENFSCRTRSQLIVP